ncbi:MAG: hypothetical protein P8104_07295 [Gammaproteobacteria bacterium]
MRSVEQAYQYNDTITINNSSNSAPALTKRDQLSSRQQLLAKQIKALIREISVQQFEFRVAKAKYMIN